MSNTKELELIAMVQHMQSEQREYWKLKAQFGNASQQLKVCKDLEKSLKKYCNDRLKEIENEQKKKPTQQQLFT